MITLMTRDQARDVARIHAAVLTDSVYTWIGRPFLEYYYRNLLENPDFACHVHTFDGKVTGFLASTSAAPRVFTRQLLRDGVRIAAVILGILAREPRKLGVVLSATRFLLRQRPTMLSHANGEVLSFAVLPEYRATEVAPDGSVRPTAFAARGGGAVATELFRAAMQALGDRGVTDVKIMTPADNLASNRFYAKVGCRVVATGLIVFGHLTNLYHARIGDLLSRAGTPTVAAEPRS